MHFVVNYVLSTSNIDVYDKKLYKANSLFDHNLITLLRAVKRRAPI